MTQPSPRHPCKAPAVLLVALVLVHGAGAHVGVFGPEARAVHSHRVTIDRDGDGVRIDVRGDDDELDFDDAPSLDVFDDDGDWS